MKVLVTGGAGFIGSHIIDALRARSDDVICIDSLDPGVHHGAPSYLRDDVDYCFVDLRAWKPDARFAGVQAIVHLAALGGVARAAREHENVITANAGGTARLVEQALAWPSLETFVLASSFSVYGSNYSYRCARCMVTRDASRLDEDLAAGRYEVMCRQCGDVADIVAITEATTPAPLETYASSKYMQELCLRGVSGPRVRIMRFSSAYGTRLRLEDSEATIIARLAGWIAAGERPTLLEDGRQIRDWVHVDDIVAAALALIDRREAPSLVNVCSGVPVRLSEACEILARVKGVTIKPDIIGGYRPGDMRHCLGDPSTLTQLIGRPPTSFAQGAASAFR